MTDSEVPSGFTLSEYKANLAKLIAEIDGPECTLEFLKARKRDLEAHLPEDSLELQAVSVLLERKTTERQPSHSPQMPGGIRRRPPGGFPRIIDIM